MFVKLRQICLLLSFNFVFLLLVSHICKTIDLELTQLCRYRFLNKLLVPYFNELLASYWGLFFLTYLYIYGLFNGQYLRPMWPNWAYSFSLWLYSPLDLGRFFRFLILYTVGRTPWTGDQPVAGPLRTHRINTHIHALSGIRTHDPSVRVGEDGSCLRPGGHCNRLIRDTVPIFVKRDWGKPWKNLGWSASQPNFELGTPEYKSEVNVTASAISCVAYSWKY
jgi:hypothetical protein